VARSLLACHWTDPSQSPHSYNLSLGDHWRLMGCVVMGPVKVTGSSHVVLPRNPVLIQDALTVVLVVACSYAGNRRKTWSTCAGRTGFQYEERADTRFLTATNPRFAHQRAFRTFDSFTMCWIGYPHGCSPTNGARLTSISFAKRRFSTSSINIE
jgi:hypothetical protein